MGNKLDKVTPFLEDAEKKDFVLDLSGQKFIGPALKGEGHLMPIPVAKRLKPFRKANLTKTGLLVLPPQILHMSALGSLTLDNNKLTTLPRELGMITTLWMLSVCHNRLTSLPPEISSLKNLKKLMLHKNELTKLPDVSGLENLTHIYLGGNRFVQLPDSIWNLKLLEELHAQENELIQVAGLGRLLNLRVINLRSNKISHFCEDIVECSALEELHLWNNCISGIPVELAQCIELRQLYIQNNAIAEVPFELTSLVNLETIDISGNPLRNPFKKLKSGTNGGEFLDKLLDLSPNRSRVGTMRSGRAREKGDAPDVIQLSELATIDLASRSRAGTFLGRGHSFSVLKMAVESLSWIRSVLSSTGAIPSGDLIYKSDFLRDGSILCRLVEKIDPQRMPSFKTPQSDTVLSRPDRAANASAVLKAFKEMGVSKKDLFDIRDMSECSDLPQVHHAILKLSGIVGGHGGIPASEPIPDNYPFSSEQVLHVVDILKLKEGTVVARAAIDRHVDTGNPPVRKSKDYTEKQLGVRQKMTAPEWLSSIGADESKIESSLTWDDLDELDKADFQEVFGSLKGAAIFKKLRALGGRASANVDDRTSTNIDAADLDLKTEKSLVVETEDRRPVSVSHEGLAYSMRERVEKVRESHAWRACPAEWLEEGWQLDPSDIKLEREIGSGSFGNVYSATYLGVRVAVKEITSKAGMSKAAIRNLMEVMKREADILRSLSHPNILQCIGSFESQNDVFYIVTELVANPGEYEDLRDMLDDKPEGLNWRFARKIATDMARGMAYLHAHHVIHRDLKSENILIDAVRAVVCDFGFAKVLDESITNAAAKRMTLCGSEGCMAPEVMMGLAYSYSADVFPYGLILWEIITPLSGMDPVWKRFPHEQYALNIDSVKQHVREGCPQSLVDLASRCTALDPARRPTFNEVVEFLDNVPDQARPSMAHKLDSAIASLVETELQSNMNATISSAFQDQVDADNGEERLQQRVVTGLLDDFFKEEMDTLLL